MHTSSQGIKYFDSKFIAINLKNVLRCPKCHLEYSQKFERAGRSTRSNRPFLLGCGHSMCENCIQQHLGELSCAVCFLPSAPTKNSKHIKNNSKYFVRDFYDLNFHILGEIYNNAFYHHFNSVNNSLNVSTGPDMIEVSMQIKCSECEFTQAAGQCQQCNANYCKSCFDKIHLHSKVLKAHKFNKLNDLSSESCIRIDSTEFKMPKAYYCNSHNSLGTYYCPKCRKHFCDFCARNFHNMHGIRLISDENQRKVSEIPSVLESVQHSRESVANSQKLIKNLEKQLDDYASQTLTNIADHFQYLHGLLQAEELRITESLREKCLVPQSKLSHTLNKLNDYERVLNNMRDKLNTYQIDIPTNISLKDALRRFFYYLDEIPTHVKVNKITKNPFVFTMNEKRIDYIMKSCSMTFNDPNLIVQIIFPNGSCRSISPRSIDISSPSPINSPNNQQRGHYTIRELKFYNQKNKSRSTDKRSAIDQPKPKQFINTNSSPSFNLSPSLSTDSTDQAQKSLTRMHTPLREIQTNSEKLLQSLKSPQQKLNLKVGVRLRLTYINSPDCFYLQTQEGFNSIKRLSESYQSTHVVQPKVANRIVVGNTYMTFNENQKIWYRTNIKEMVEPNVYRAFLVDIGYGSTIDTNGIVQPIFYELDDMQAAIPYTAMCCGISGVKPLNKRWSKEASQFLNEIASKHALLLRFAEHAGKQYYNVDMFADNGYSKISVRDAFLYTGLAKENPGNNLCVLDSVDKQKCKPPCHNRITTLILEPGMSIKATLIHVETPSEFFVIQQDMIKERDNFCNRLNDHFAALPDSKMDTLYLGEPLMGCIVNLNSTWHRARIEKIITGGKVVIFLIDHGREETVHWRELFVLPKDFQNKHFTLRCALADVEPLQNNNYTWTEEASSALRQLGSNPQLNLVVISVENDLHKVSLHFARNGVNNNIGAIFVKKGFGISTGPCSSMPTKGPDQPNCFNLNLNLKPVLATMQSELNSGAAKKGIHGSKVHIVHVVDPSEFYVRLADIEEGFKSFESYIQTNTKDTIACQVDANYVEERIWRENDHCLVNTKIEKSAILRSGCSEEKWYRGIITAVPVSKMNTKKITTYNVYLRDYGVNVEGIRAVRLHAIDSTLDNIVDCVQRCRLAGLMPPEVLWSKSAIDYFKHILTECETCTASVLVVKKGCVDVILWSVTQNDDDPIALTTKKFVNVNELIANAGFATYKLSTDSNLHNVTFLDNGFESIESLLNIVDFAFNHQQLKHDLNDQCSVDNNSDSFDLKVHLRDLRDESITATTSLPPAWLNSRPLKKTIFTAKPTYVDYSANVYVHLPCDKDFLQLMKVKLNELYKETFESRLYFDEIYTENQPCVVIYHMDQCYYRGIVKKILENNNYEVYFLDYGNEEVVDTLSMIPYAPLPKLHSMCIRLRIHGIQPKDPNGYSTDNLDKIHRKIVDDLVSVKILDDKFTQTELLNCTLRVDSLDIGEFLVKQGIAVFTKPQSKKIRHATTPTTTTNLTQHNSYDNMAQLASGDQIDTLVEGFQNMNSSPINQFCISLESHQSPPSKKPMFDWDELKQFEESNLSETDTIQQYSSLPITEYSSDFNKFYNKKSHNKIFNTVNNDYDIDENNMIEEQLQNRIRIQLEDKNDFGKFCPFDTSTVVSLFTSVDAIKPQKLPHGATEFYCSIDSIISATELQIFPNITEFKKRDIAMAREIARLVKLAPNLRVCEPNMLVLACYPRDRKWYRGIVRTYNSYQREALVLYIDFLNSETLPLRKLKQMPDALFAWPLRSLRVKLHNVTPNPNMRETEVRKALHRCTLKSSELYARVVQPPAVVNVNSSNSSTSDISEENHKNLNCKLTELCSPTFLDGGQRIDTVELYASEDSEFPIYQKLIDRKVFITHNNY